MLLEACSFNLSKNFSKYFECYISNKLNMEIVEWQIFKILNHVNHKVLELCQQNNGQNPSNSISDFVCFITNH